MRKKVIEGLEQAEAGSAGWSGEEMQCVQEIWTVRVSAEHGCVHPPRKWGRGMLRGSREEERGGERRH